MLQRIQTIYLLLIVILTTSMLFLPLAIIQTADGLFTFDVFGITSMTTPPELIYATWGIFALTAAISLIALVTIFLFKKRILQMRICVFNAILMLGFYALFGFFFWTLTDNFPAATLNGKITLSFPLINLILDYLAIRNIGADETLVRSLDRLR